METYSINYDDLGYELTDENSLDQIMSEMDNFSLSDLEPFNNEDEYIELSEAS